MFYYELAEIVAVASDEQTGQVRGFTLLSVNNEYYRKHSDEYYPHIAVEFSGVHPEHQQSGVWRALREFVEDVIAPEYDAEYLMTSVPVENEASRAANESMGMSSVSVDTDFIKEYRRIPRGFTSGMNPIGNPDTNH